MSAIRAAFGVAIGLAIASTDVDMQRLLLPPATLVVPSHRDGWRPRARRSSTH